MIFSNYSSVMQFFIETLNASPASRPMPLRGAKIVNLVAGNLAAPTH